MSSAYCVITPVRDEAPHLPRTLQSLAAQTIPPRCWVIVNDGSTDATGTIADEAAKQHPWIRVVHRTNRGFRKSGSGVIEAFYAGFGLVRDQAWDFLVKLDGDLSFEADYFERCLSRFAADPALGIGGGTVCSIENGVPVPDSPNDARFHVRGATKIYRHRCWDAIGGVKSITGWDTLDEVKANMLGWHTETFAELPIIQHKKTGIADGTWRNWFKNGRANYIVGYHPIFMTLKCVSRLFRPPVGIASAGLLSGFFSGYLSRIPQIDDPDVIRYLRRQQLNKLLGRPSLWP